MEYVFYRELGFYLIDIPDDMLSEHGEAKCIADNAACNPGTLKVERIDGTTAWEVEVAG